MVLSGVQNAPTFFRAFQKPIYVLCSRKYDAAIKGLGGCPFADDKLTGNLPTELLLDYLNSIGETTNVSQEAFSKAYGLATSVFI